MTTRLLWSSFYINKLIRIVLIQYTPTNTLIIAVRCVLKAPPLNCIQNSLLIANSLCIKPQLIIMVTRFLYTKTSIQKFKCLDNDTVIARY